MKLDCEIISQEFLPVLRAAMAKELASMGMSQKEVADVLGISQPAVSQYLRDIRGAGNHFTSDQELYSNVKEMCQIIASREANESYLKEKMYMVCETALRKKR